MTDEHFSGIHSGLGGEALRQRGNAAVGQIEFHTLQTVHGEKNYAGGKWLAILDQRDQVVKRCQLHAAKAQAFRRERKDGAPKLLPRISQSHEHHDAGTKRIATWARNAIAWIANFHPSDCRREEQTLQPSDWILIPGFDIICGDP